MATGKTNVKAGKAAKPKTAVQQALEVTWLLKGQLKTAQMSYLRVGGLLAQVRDAKLYAELKHPDIESYADERLHLARSSLYKYLRVYDWVCRKHKEWIEPKPQGFIPDLSDAADLIWIETELERKDLDRDTRARLQEFRKQALDGRMRQAEFAKWRKSRKRGGAVVKSLLMTLRRARRSISTLEPPLPEALSRIDGLIDMLDNVQTLKVARLDDIWGSEAPESHRSFLA